MYLEDRGKVFGLFNVGEVAAPSVPIPAERGAVGIEGAAATVGVAAPSGGDWEVGLGRVGQAQKERFFGVEIDARGGSGGGGGGDGLGHTRHRHVGLGTDTSCCSCWGDADKFSFFVLYHVDFECFLKWQMLVRNAR